MTKLITRRTAMFSASAAAAMLMASPRIAQAANSFDVQMLTKHPENKKLRNVFLPRIQVIEPGDTVNFIATDKSHNSASSKGMVPEGTEEWKGKLNKDIAVTFDKPGFYGYQCTPHTTLGMVGLIIVKGEGMMDNLEAAKAVKQKGKAKKVWKEIWEEVEALEL